MINGIIKLFYSEVVKSKMKNMQSKEYCFRDEFKDISNISMKVDNFFIKLNEQLNTYKHQYDRQDEGRVYIGLPDFNFSNFTKEEKIYFVYYSSLFVAFDLLVYSYDKENYLKQKGCRSHH